MAKRPRKTGKSQADLQELVIVAFAEDLEQATHDYLLPNRDNITVNIDYKQRGVGGNNSWGYSPLDKYRLFEKSYSYKFLIRPYHPDMGDISDLARRRLP